MQYLLTYKKWILFLVTLLVGLIVVEPVLADYLGPNRTVTETSNVCYAILYQCKNVKGKWRYKKVEDWLCANESKPWEVYPDNSLDCGKGINEGYKYWGQSEIPVTTTITHPSATIIGSIECTWQNGWCRSGTTPMLALNAQEPLPAYSILLIEGTLNGAIFACQSGATSCSVPLHEGDNSFTYWALSSWGDSSAMGTSAARVDTIQPDVGLDISGVGGMNGWYVSPTTVTATGADATSGVASALLDINDGTPQPSATLNEGVYKIDVEVVDNAGNASNSTTTISVDTTTPSINASISGTTGNNGWYKSFLQVSALASDATAGVATFEVSVDGAAYQSYTSNSAISFTDGHHTIRFKAVDWAGNRTETPLQEFYIDTIAPVVDLLASWQLGRNVPYSAQDDGSGLAALRIVIEDEDERYAKVAWSETVSGDSYSQDIDWNGQFKDKTVAPPGIYLVWIKASDRAGNEHFELGKVIVPQPNGLLSLLPSEELSVGAVPPEPPAELSETEGLPPDMSPSALDFGGGAAEPGEVTTHSLLLTTGTAGGIKTSANPSGILWGAAAAAVIAVATAYALEATRKRQEAEAAQAAQVMSEIARDKERHADKLQKQLENQAAQQALEQSQHDYPIQIDLKVARMEEEEGAALRLEKLKQFFNRILNEDSRTERKETQIEGEFRAFSAEPQDWKSDYDEYMAQKALEDAPKEQSFSEQQEGSGDQVWLWVDQHQAEIALGIGIIVGIAAILLSGGVAAPLVAAAWIAGAAAVAAGTAAAGTVILNNHYGREWHENLATNIAISGLSAAVVSGAWFIFQTATTAMGPLCYRYQAICGRIEPVLNALDWGEEAWLSTKMGLQTLTGNDVGAAETALELQMEHMDGGIPGNAVAKELAEKLGEETIENVAKYGDEALSLVMLYGDDAAQIIMTYGDDGVALLQKYGNDTIDLIARYKDEAIDFMERAEKLGIDPTDVLDNPPLSSQTLEGWLLDIDNPENPVNMPLKFNLLDAEIDQLMRESIQNSDSRLFSIGYGKDAKIPFDEMANHFGNDYKMSFLAMPDSKWAKYSDAKAYGDFWEVNSDAIEWGIEERKIFVLNIDYDLAADASNPLSTRRFTYAELKLIENPTSNYTIINNGEYSFFVPNELLDTYQNFLPPELLAP